MNEVFDYVIVGSGAAGASAARVLADGGGTIAVLEEGPAVSTEEFEDLALPTYRRLYRGMGAQTTRGRAPVLVVQGRCLGGSTVVNSAIMRRLPEEVWQEWDSAHGLGHALPFGDIEAASDRIEEELQVAPTAKAIWGGNNAALSRASELSGIQGSPTHRNAPGCRGSARCNMGCPHGAKQSMQLSYLPYAQRRGALLISDERAEQVVWQGKRAVGVRTAKGTVHARKAVVVAASAVQTPGLLWRSGVRSAHLGRHFQGHPGIAIVGLFDHQVRLGDGATQGFEVDGLRVESQVKLETLAVPPETFFAGMPGTGRRWVALMAEFGKAALWVLPLRAQAEGTIGMGRSEGSIDYVVSSGDLSNLRRGVRHAAELMFLAGAREVVCPIYGLPDTLRPDQLELIESASDDAAAYPMAMSHLFGTARMSLRPEAGVVGPDFGVHGSDNLYVVDSSVFPTNLGVNPQLAIMALARLAAGRLLD